MTIHLLARPHDRSSMATLCGKRGAAAEYVGAVDCADCRQRRRTIIASWEGLVTRADLQEAGLPQWAIEGVSTKRE